MLDRNGKILWAKSYGTLSYEEGQDIKETSDNNLVFLSSTTNGYTHFAVTKIDLEGNILWQKNFGGNFSDYSSNILVTNDDGLLIFGKSYSNTFPWKNHGGTDLFLIKLDSTGNQQWQKNYGGSWDELPGNVINCNEGGYIFSAYTYSNDFDVSGNHSNFSNYDGWVVRIDSLGVIQWQKCIGGSYTEQLFDIKENAKGNFIACGFADSNDGDLDGLNPDFSSAWVIELSSQGNFLWQKIAGGTDKDSFNSLQLVTDDKIIFLGETGSDDGDVVGHHPGDMDLWLVYLVPVNTVKGNVFVDANFNSVKDSDELILNNVLVTTKSDSIQKSSLTKDGRYLNEVDTGNYTTTAYYVYPYYNIIPLSYPSSYRVQSC